MTVQNVDDYINEKLKENSDFVRYTYYELRVKEGLSCKETEDFLELNEIYFNNKNYSVYRTGDVFEYEGARRTVQSNELMIVVKEKDKK